MFRVFCHAAASFAQNGCPFAGQATFSGKGRIAVTADIRV
jgi:hypothetical protein